MPQPLLKLIWVLWCGACIALLLAALYYRGDWPISIAWGAGIALFVGQWIVGRLLVKSRRQEEGERV